MKKIARRRRSVHTSPARSATPRRAARKESICWEIDLLQRNRNFRLKSALVKRTAQEVLNDLAAGAGRKRPPLLSHYHLSLLFIGDEEIRVLNREYRGKDKPTDVLSFSQVEGAGLVRPSLGDIVISLDTTRTQARRFGVSLDAELLRLLVHGMLHLIGYDHEKVPAAQAAAMRRLERRLLHKFSSGFRGALRLDAQRSKR